MMKEGYCKDNLCPQANEGDSGKDSLSDFLEKLQILRSEGLVGEWNLTQVVKRADGSRYLAINLAAVFPIFQQRFSPNYSQQSIQQLIKGIEGYYTNASFVATKQEWLDYERALSAYKRGERDQRPSIPAKNSGTKCWQIPQAVIDKVWGVQEGIDTDPLTNNFSSYPTETIEPPAPAQDESTDRAEELHPGDKVILVDGDYQKVAKGSTFTIAELRESTPTEEIPKPTPFAVVVGVDGGRHSVWLQHLRRYTENDRLGNWEVA